MLLLITCVSLVNLIVSPVYGLIQINSKPAKVANGNFVRLACNVGTMRSPVKWVYGGKTYFSCNSPYTNCLNHTDITTDGFYRFSINDDSFTMLFLVNKNQNDGIWSCYHGIEKADLEIDNEDRAEISFYTYSNDQPGQTDIRCNVQSELPVDVLIYAVDYQGKKTLYDVKQSNLSLHSLVASGICSAYIIYCNVTNGYGNVSANTHSGLRYDLECPLKILRNMPINTNLTFNDRTSTGKKIKIYYEGNRPSWSLYRIDEENIQAAASGVNVHINHPSETEPAYAYVYIFDYNTVKAGKYKLVLKQDNITEVVNLNIIYSTIKTTTTTTALPVVTSILDKNTKHSTTQGTILTTPEDGMFKKEIKDETKMMFNVGVAGFVISLLLVLILVIVGVVWFKRIQRKQADSVDQSQVKIRTCWDHISTAEVRKCIASWKKRLRAVQNEDGGHNDHLLQETNGPNHIYEDLNKN